jgi:flagellar hook-associated protein 2
MSVTPTSSSTSSTSSASSSATSSTDSTSLTGSTLLGANGSLGNGTVIDVNAILTKLDAVEQAPIDAVQSKINQNNVAISDLGTLQSQISAFQTTLQAFTDPLSYSDKTINSSDTTVATAAVSSNTTAQAGNYALAVTSLASSYSESFGGQGATYSIADPSLATVAGGSGATPSMANFFGLTSGTTFTLKSGTNAAVTVDLSTSTTLNAVRDFINQSTSTSGIQAAVVDTGYGYSLNISTVAGGAANSIQTTMGSSGSGSTITPTISQNGTDAIFTINGQSFKSQSNTVLNAIPGVQLQLQKAGTPAVGSTPANPVTSMITVTSSAADNAQTLVSNMISAYNTMMTSYQQLSAYNSDPTKQGALYGDTTLATIMNSISYSLMTGFTQADSSGNQQPLLDNNGKPVSMTSLGIELQVDGTVSFNSSFFNNAISAGVFDKLAQGFTSPTKTSVDSAIGVSGSAYTGMLATDVTGLNNENTYLQSQVTDMTTRKAAQMAEYQTQYAALDALLYQLQSTNNALTPTFNALNNPVKTS